MKTTNESFLLIYRWLHDMRLLCGWLVQNIMTPVQLWLREIDIDDPCWLLQDLEPMATHGRCLSKNDNGTRVVMVASDIIESVDSISRDGMDVTCVILYKNGKISRMVHFQDF